MSRVEIFATTHPSLVARLFDERPTMRDSAWSELVARYEEPIACCVGAMLRCAPSGAPATEELVPSFFSYLLLGDVLAKWDKSRGPMRAYIQGVLRRFLAAALRERRGAGDPVRDLDDTCDPVDDDVALEFERRWAYQVFVLALGNLARRDREQAELWLRLEGLSWLVADRERWVVRCYDEAIHGSPTHDPEVCTPSAVAAARGLAIGTIHNRKYKANTLLLSYIGAELRRHESAADERSTMGRFFSIMRPLVPGLAVLENRPR